MVERPPVGNKPIKFLGDMLVADRGFLMGGLHRDMVPYKEEVEKLNKPPVHAFLSAFFLSFLLHSVESCVEGIGAKGGRKEKKRGRGG